MRIVSFVVSLVLMLAVAGHAHAATKSFATWLKDFYPEALAAGVSKSTLTLALPFTMEVKEKVVKLDKKQPERSKKYTFEMYKNNVINNRRIKEGREYLQSEKALLNKVTSAYKVEPQFITALWGLETSYGKNTGGFEVVRALATLAYEGRREKFFRKELINALKIIDAGHIKSHEMKGSWAGAMGQCQFMPSSFLAYAEDFNKDGKKDIWTTREDVFASIANYLKQSGWLKGQPMMERVRLPEGFDRNLITLDTKKTIGEWSKLGVKYINGKPLPEWDISKVSIIQPGGKGYKTYIAYNNYRVIMKWNRSTFFATSVALLADELIKG